jgi:hypothetical protein
VCLCCERLFVINHLSLVVNFVGLWRKRRFVMRHSEAGTVGGGLVRDWAIC